MRLLRMIARAVSEWNKRRKARKLIAAKLARRVNTDWLDDG